MLHKQESTTDILTGLSRLNIKNEAQELPNKELAQTIDEKYPTTEEDIAVQSAFLRNNTLTKQIENSINIHSSYLIDYSQLNILYRINGSSRSDVFFSKWNDKSVVTKKSGLKKKPRISIRRCIVMK